MKANDLAEILVDLQQAQIERWISKGLCDMSHVGGLTLAKPPVHWKKAFGLPKKPGYMLLQKQAFKPIRNSDEFDWIGLIR